MNPFNADMAFLSTTQHARFKGEYARQETQLSGCKGKFTLTLTVQYDRAVQSTLILDQILVTKKIYNLWSDRNQTYVLQKKTDWLVQNRHE